MSDEFSRFFSGVSPERTDDVEVKDDEGNTWTISGYTYVSTQEIHKSGRYSKYPSVYCVPTEYTLDFIKRNMLSIPNDTIYFKMFIFENEARIYAEYNTILGSRLLGVVRNDTIPFLKDEVNGI